MAPELISAMIIKSALAFLVGAVGRRIGGGVKWLDINTQVNRLLWGVTGGLTVFALGQPWFVAIGVALSIAICSGLFGYALPGQPARAMLMGRKEGADPNPPDPKLFWLDFANMTYHGVGGVLFLVIGAFFLKLAWLPLLVAGLLCAPCYALAYMWKPNVPFMGMLNMPEKGLVDPAPTGEFLWGGCVGVALALTCILV